MNVILRQFLRYVCKVEILVGAGFYLCMPKSSARPLLGPILFWLYRHRYTISKVRQNFSFSLYLILPLLISNHLIHALGLSVKQNDHYFALLNQYDDDP